MSDIDKLQFQKLDFAGLQTLVKWAEEEGWNPGGGDAEVYWQTDADGFYGYYEGTELIAGGSIVSYGGEFGFMGFFIVKPEHRGAGIGRKLWYERRDKLISRLAEGATIGMDGVVAMQSFYQKGGFEIAFRDIRYEIKGRACGLSAQVSEIAPDDMETVLEMDRQCFGYERTRFMVAWLNMEGSKAFKFVEGGRLKGFVVVRKAKTGYKICPLFAESKFVAEELLKVCLNAYIGEKIYLDIPEPNREAKDLVEEYGGEYVFECARMYRGTAPSVGIDKVYGITTFELG